MPESSNTGAGARFQHRKGGTYEVLGHAQLQTDVALADMAELVLYRAEKDGSLWARRAVEFYDGRFAEIDPRPPAVALSALSDDEVVVEASLPPNPRALPRVTEPDENLVHYTGPSIIGNVTLCGLTDFIHHKKAGKPTSKPCTCNGCLGIVDFVRSGGRKG